jgi:hypothetical protein
LYGTVAFPSKKGPECYVLVAGEHYRPTPEEAEGHVAVDEAIEPFRSMMKDKDLFWRYEADRVLEIVDEKLCDTLRTLLEAVVEFSIIYRTLHFFCSPQEQDQAYKSGLVLDDIIRKRGRTKTPSIVPIPMKASEADSYCESLVRSLTRQRQLQFNQDCRHVLSENPLALKGLGIAAFVGSNFSLRNEVEDRNHIALANTYH